MGVAKAGLEAVSRYLARDLGPQGRPREPRLAPGRSGTLAANGIPGFDDLADAWDAAGAAGLGHRGRGARSRPPIVLPAVATTSRAITGEILHVDGGFHAMGTAPVPDREEAVA